MKTFFTAVLFFLSTSVARADYLECNNGKEQDTDIGFYNHYGKIVFQLSAPHYDDYLYVLGNCDSDNSSGIGLPYTCEVAPGQANVVTVRLVADTNRKPIADLSFHFEDGTSHNERIACQHIRK